MKGFKNKNYKNTQPKLNYRVNDRIRIPEVRLILADGSQAGIVTTLEAKQKALEYGLDLIEIAPQAKPPVCKIADFGKMQYEHGKKQKLQQKKKNTNVTKTIKIKPNIGDNDLGRRISEAQKFLDKGYRVVVCVTMRGRQQSHPEIAYNKLDLFTINLENAAAEKPTRAGNRISMSLSKTEPKP